MDPNTFLYPTADERPLDRLVEGYSRTSVFRRVAFIGDSLSSGEFETVDQDGVHGYHDLYEYAEAKKEKRRHGNKFFLPWMIVGTAFLLAGLLLRIGL